VASLNVNIDNSADYRHNFGVLDIIKKTKIRMAHVGDVLLEMQSARAKDSKSPFTFATFCTSSRKLS